MPVYPDARELGRRWFEEVWNRRNDPAIDELMAPDAYDLKAARAWYVELLFIKDTSFLPLLAYRYDIGEPCRVERGGYWLAVREMRLRSSAATRPSVAASATSDIAGASPCAQPWPALSAH